MDDCSRFAGEESPDTSPAIAGQAHGLTTRREINNARGANRDAECRKTRGAPSLSRGEFHSNVEVKRLNPCWVQPRMRARASEQSEAQRDNRRPPEMARYRIRLIVSLIRSIRNPVA